MISRRRVLQAGSAAALGSLPTIGRAANTPGVSDTEIKIGQTMPYSGPASAYGIIGRTEAAYFRMINEMGGVNGRKVTLISLDDGFSPPRTVEQTRRLVEVDNVAFIYQSLGDPCDKAVRPYLNDHKIPQILLAAGGDQWADPKHFPWTMGYYLSYGAEGRIYAQAILANNPKAKIAILYENDDGGRNYLAGLREGLGDKAESLIAKEVSYNVTDPTVDSQIITLQSSGADTFFNVTTPKFAAQAIRKVYDIGWRPVHYLASVSLSIGAVLKPAGLEKSKGIISCLYIKDPSDPRWKDDPGVKRYLTFIDKYMRGGNVSDAAMAHGYDAAQTLVRVLKQCGNDLSRENILRQATNLKDFETDLVLPGVNINTSPDNYRPLRQMQMARFNGSSWELFGKMMQG